MNRCERRAALRGFLATVSADPAFLPATGPRLVRTARRTLHCLATATMRGFGHISVLTADGRVLQILASEVLS